MLRNDLYEASTIIAITCIKLFYTDVYNFLVYILFRFNFLWEENVLHQNLILYLIFSYSNRQYQKWTHCIPFNLKHYCVGSKRAQHIGPTFCCCVNSNLEENGIFSLVHAFKALDISVYLFASSSVNKYFVLNISDMFKEFMFFYIQCSDIFA